MKVKLTHPVAIETRAIRSIENAYLKQSTSKIYLALEDVNLVWDAKQARRAVRRWNEGQSPHAIAKEFRRPIEDVVALLLDLSLKGRLKEREGGIFGSEVREWKS